MNKLIPFSPSCISGDSCCNPFSLGHFSKFLEEQMPTVYIKSLRIGNNSIEVRSFVKEKKNG